MKSIAAGLSLLVSSSLYATPILDQVNEAPVSSLTHANNSYLTQEIIPAISGTLTAVELEFQSFSASDGAFIMLSKIYPSASETTATLIGVRGWTRFDLTDSSILRHSNGPFEVTAGESFYLTVGTFRAYQSMGGPGIAMSGNFNYPGWLQFTNSITDCFSDCSYDLRFRTYVEPATSVPAPSLLSLLAIGLVGIVLVKSQQKNGQV